MSVSLHSLLAHPALADMKLAAGEPDQQISAVWGVAGSLEQVTATLTHSPSRDLTGVLLVLLSPVRRLDWRFDTLLRRSAGHGITAVLFAEPDTTSVSLDPGAALLAARLKIAVLTSVDPWQASVSVHELLGSADAAVSRTTLQVARIGLQAGEELEEALHLLESELGRALVLIDGSGEILRSAEQFDEADALALRELGRLRSPCSLPLGGGRSLVAAPVGTGFGPRSWIGAVVQTELQTELAATLAALEVASVVVGHRLVLRRLVDERDARHRTALLDELRDAELDVQPGLLQRAVEAGWRLHDWHVGVRLIAQDAVDVVSQRVEVQSAFAAEGLDVEVVEQVDGWVLWTSSIDEPDPVQLADISSRFRRGQGHLRKSIATFTGVGRAHAGAVGLMRSLAEAGDAARLAGTRPQSGYFLHVDRLGLAQLLLAWTRTDTFQPAAAQLLEPLRDAGGDLQVTLGTYLDTESSLAETAAILGIHRNTVADRIARSERLLNVDLGDPETRLALHLACRSVKPG
ncbi:helix-turn-helix domain-containing protein [Saxibacter everestensis]|uniref:Helix-turn-helix domain-containing protein n=1 Tax=Saxibacter everestensis TaxID=2909229 RepID=A0ABY8QR87_9MICO|nr:helix-turn-helix domain-containing protein [Brevibacteriaceae bacterium ZFBP1038]